MGDRARVSRKYWPTHIYDYNYKVSEGYYKPQKDYMNTIDKDRYVPPKHQSYAERFASNPWYGSKHGLPYSGTNSALNEPLYKPTEHRQRSSSLLREIIDHEDNDIPLNVRASRRRRKFEQEEMDRGIIPSRLYRASSVDDYKTSKKDITEGIRKLEEDLIRLGPRRKVTEDSYYSKLSSNNHSDLPPIPRNRSGSVTELDFSHHRSSRQSSLVDGEEQPSYIKRADKIREERRVRESREITNGIHGMIDKMRSTYYNPEDGYYSREDRGNRPSKVDPTLVKSESKVKSTFTYGIPGRF